VFIAEATEHDNGFSQSQPSRLAILSTKNAAHPFCHYPKGVCHFRYKRAIRREESVRENLLENPAVFSACLTRTTSRLNEPSNVCAHVGCLRARAGVWKANRCERPVSFLTTPPCCSCSCSFFLISNISVSRTTIRHPLAQPRCQPNRHSNPHLTH
jgi:hypothetical protein